MEAKTEITMKEIQLQQREKLTIDKIVMNENPYIMSVEEQMAAKGGLILTLTFIGGAVLKKKVLAGGLSAAISAGKKYVAKNGLQLAGLAVAEIGTGFVIYQHFFGDSGYDCPPCPCDCPPGYSNEEEGYESAPIPPINVGCFP